jgi:copper resistance protein B
MKRLMVAVATFPIALLSAPASAQDMKGMKMPGMTMPAPPAKKPVVPKAARKKPAAATSTARAPGKPKPVARAPAQKSNGAATPAATGPSGEPVSGMDGMKGMVMPGEAPVPPQPMPGMAMSPAQTGTPEMPGMPGMTTSGTALPAGNAPAPAPPADHYADRAFPQGEMNGARTSMMKESGRQNFHQVFFNLAEYQFHEGKDGYRWDGQAWFGGDINRLTVKTEGEGTFREGVDSAEVQALYSRAIGPYFNLQAGVRHDFQPSPTRSYATVGVEGLAPYMFETEAALFLSEKGDVLGRLAGWYDQRITQRLILQPRVELNLAAQDVPETRIGAGLSNAELGLRLRYEIAREFAPYVGISYDAKTGRTADYARADGRNPTTTSFVAGVRFWF